MKNKYAIPCGINHPSIGMTHCPFCKAPRWVPCHVRGYLGGLHTRSPSWSGPYAERTHMDRIRLANVIAAKEKTKEKRRKI